MVGKGSFSDKLTTSTLLAPMNTKDSLRTQGFKFSTTAPKAETDSDSLSTSMRSLDSSASAAMMDKTPQKQFLIDPVYKSTLAYRPSDYFTPKGKYYEDEDDLESQKEDEKAILASAYAERKSRRRRSCNMCCCTIGYLILIVLLVGAIVVIKLIPKDPAVSVGQLTVTEFNYNESSSSLTVNLGYDLTVRNRNPHADAIYNSISLGLFFQNETLGSFNVSPDQFEQKKKHTTMIVANLPETTITIENQANADSLKSQEASKNVQMNLTGSVKGKLKVLGMKVKKFDVDISCSINLKPGCHSPDCYTCTCYTAN